ncbi:Holliday junction ATP-dependent DNA helicase RuvB [Actinomycetota bacterium]|nr:Holliday junction ATP-dependent DNA helicase RuvB [Actinomycetota bacterium]
MSIVNTSSDVDDVSAEYSLRPKNLQEFVGQTKVVEQLQLICDSAKSRGVTPDHMLFSGPPGLGKTTLAQIVSNEMQAKIKITSGPSLTHAGDLAAILSALTEGEILFIDEIHRMSKPAQEMLYIAMEDFRIDVVVGKGVGAQSIALPLPKFTLIGATTRSGLLPAPLRDRFGWIAQMDYYEPEELKEIVNRSARLMGVKIKEDAALEIAQRSRQTARIANRMLSRVRDYAHINTDDKVITKKEAQAALKLYEVDELGLDKLDRSIIDAIVNRFGGGPVGISTLSSALGEEEDTISSTVEPYLVRVGLINRTPSGRVITDKGLMYIKGGLWT